MATRKKKTSRKSIISLPKQLGLIDYGKILASLDKVKDLFSFWGLMYAAQASSVTIPFKFYHMITSAMAYKQLDNTITGLQAQGYIAGELANYLLKITLDLQKNQNKPPPPPPLPDNWPEGAPEPEWPIQRDSQGVPIIPPSTAPSYEEQIASYEYEPPYTPSGYYPGKWSRDRQ